MITTIYIEHPSDTLVYDLTLTYRVYEQPADRFADNRDDFYGYIDIDWDYVSLVEIDEDGYERMVDKEAFEDMFSEEEIADVLDVIEDALIEEWREQMEKWASDVD